MDNARRRCNNVTTRFAGVGMLCWGEPGHDGLHHSRHGNYTWPDPPERLERESRLSWRRRERAEWTRERIMHPYSSICWLWVYRDQRGRCVEAEELLDA
jgi:hypothetical protein